MEVFVVGGALRDKLMGIVPKDMDYVVVGSDVDEMLNLGYKQVGADFPVFLHPESGDEYALARTERKSGKGYLGFDVNSDNTVTLEDDLARRDLTMNSMAVPIGRWFDDDWADSIVDPFNGKQDIEHGILRHTTIAFRDDPVRVLRIARFAARYDFRIADETYHLIFDMLPELSSLQPDRVWSELSRTLMEPFAYRFFHIMDETNAIRYIFPQLNLTRLMDETYMINFAAEEILLRAHASGLSLAQRYACIASDLESHVHGDMKASGHCAKMACAVGKTLQRVIDAESLCAADLRQLMIDLKMRQQPEFASDALFTIKTMMFTGDEVDEMFSLAFDYNVDMLWECDTELKTIDKAKLSVDAKRRGDNIGDVIRHAELQKIMTTKALWDAKHGN